MIKMSPLNPTATPFLPAVTSLPTLSDAALTSTLDLLFEPAPELHELALPNLRTLSFNSYNDLINTLREQLLAIASSIDQDEKDAEVARKPLHAILGSHPRLGEPKKETLSKQSANEQGHLLANTEEAEMLKQLNREYEDKFPGLRYVVFVNGRPRTVIMDDMRKRIARGDIREEEREAINAMCDIAIDRATKLLKSSQEALESST
ncbi:Oxo-4-hydroxy-4-carboxy-5-ureidoimidazoline decarboxylase [Rhypophila decipiens]|uniref:Oxo-4-hydroxy-4-carboxy-5-ureidoimidazoline decarboxylase n=1 Tax=Rhypophila decipiens TaxID=261697 RepID=A0AAN6YGP8_9PEZI|nr:Oxo-4-hydroxy-4-carboxy-5-ureidoimidazoline decarboxylase [Rhypophila decipiens]